MDKAYKASAFCQYWGEKVRILLVSNHLTSVGSFQESIKEGYISKDSIISCMSSSVAFDVVSGCGIDVVIAHMDLSFCGEGAKLLMGIKKKNPDIHTLLIIKSEDFNKIDPEMAVYIDDYITQPFNKSELKARITKALISAGQRETAVGFEKGNERVRNTAEVGSLSKAVGINETNNIIAIDREKRTAGIDRGKRAAEIDRGKRTTRVSAVDSIEGTRAVRQAANEVNDTVNSIDDIAQSVNDIDNTQGYIDNDMPGTTDDFLTAGAMGNDTFNAAEYTDVPLRRAKRSHKKNKYTRSKRNNGKSPGKVARVIGQFFIVLLLLLLSFLAFFLLQSSIGSGTPSILGNQMYVVISGSMKPTFDAGSLVFVREVDPRSIAVGDIITFKGADGGPILTTHRVVEINDGEQLTFITRGDANNVNDPNPVPAENVVGRVRAYIPYIGYLITFSQTKMGLVFMIFVPGGILIVYELYNIYTYTGKRKGRREVTDGKSNYYNSEDGISRYA